MTAKPTTRANPVDKFPGGWVCRSCTCKNAKGSPACRTCKKPTHIKVDVAKPAEPVAVVAKVKEVQLTENEKD